MSRALGLFAAILLSGCTSVSLPPPQPGAFLYIGNRGAIERLLLSDTQHNNDSQPVTPSTWNILGYWTDAPTQRIIVSEGDDQNGNRLWLVRSGKSRPKLLLDCRPMICGGVAWNSIDNRLLFERSSPGDDEAPQLHWLDLLSGATDLTTELTFTSGYGVQWSPDGEWISYASPTDHALRLHNVPTGEQAIAHIHTDQPVKWRHDGRGFLVTHMLADGLQFGSRLLYLSLDTHQDVNLSGDLSVEDGPGTFSPDDAWIAFGRRISGTGMGKQIWIMDSAGGRATALTSDARAHHSSILWSPSGHQLLFQRTLIMEPELEAEIWLLNVSDGAMTLLTESASNPSWWSP